jgi:hypothetical protein
MTEEAQAREIANRWLEFQMNPLVQMVPGDPDCDACVLARQYLRAVPKDLVFSPDLFTPSTPMRWIAPSSDTALACV